MNYISSLAEVVRVSWGYLISAYGLSVIDVDNDNVLLRGPKYAIDIMTDRDGVSMIYIDTQGEPIAGYNLFLFLWATRKDRLTFFAKEPVTTTRAQWLNLHVGILAQHLENAGQDILEGSRAWIESYPGAPLQPARKIAGLL